jgi:murein DD-endopeptidase MepM/ murein hydrolase activator NlpD
MSGCKKKGPLCASKLGMDFIDPGTMARTRSPLPGPLGIYRHDFLDDLKISGPLSRIGPSPPAPPLTPDIRQGKYVFPVRGDCKYADTWAQARPGGRPHHGVDIFAEEGTAVCAVTDGYITLIANWPGAGLTVRHAADDKFGYEYMHLKDFHQSIIKAFGGLNQEFYDKPSISQIKRGRVRVNAGQVIGEVGCTGFRPRSRTDAHLHFQAYSDHRFQLNTQKGIDERINPYAFLAKLSTGSQPGEPANIRHYVFSKP